MSYWRASQAYENLRLEKSLNGPAWKQLGAILARDGKMTDHCVDFDYTAEPWTRWEELYHTLESVASFAWPVDGMMAFLAGFTLRVLAKGRVCPNGDGSYTITVTGISVFAHDKFNFEGDASLRYWNCEKREYSLTRETDYQPLFNSQFNTFRKKYILGNDFLILSSPHSVEIFQEQRYEYQP